MKVAVIVGIFLSVAVSAPASAQGLPFRPGSEPGGGRIGKLCNNELLSGADRADCFKEMKDAKTSEERDKIRAKVQATIKDLQRQNDEARRQTGFDESAHAHGGAGPSNGR